MKSSLGCDFPFFFFPLFSWIFLSLCFKSRGIDISLFFLFSISSTTFEYSCGSPYLMIIANVHIQVVNWRDTEIILWIWSFSFSQLTRYYLSYSARTLFQHSRCSASFAIWFYMFFGSSFHSSYYTFFTRKGWVCHLLPSKKLWNTWTKVQGINSCYIRDVYHMVETDL